MPPTEAFLFGLLSPWALGALVTVLAAVAIGSLMLSRRRVQALNAELARQVRAARDSEHFVRKIADAMPSLMGYWTHELRCAFANDGYREWFGRSPEEMVGMSIRDLLGAELFEKNEPLIRAALRGEPQCFERTLVKADGTRGHILANYIPDISEGAVRGFMVLVQDITELKTTQLALEQANAWLLGEAAERKRAEEALQESEATLRAYYEGSSACMGIVELGEDDLLHVYDNPAACSFFGAAPGAASGRWASSMGVPRTAIGAWRDKCVESARRCAPINFECPHDPPGQPQRWLDISVAPLACGPSGRPRFCYVAVDITEAKRVLSELERANADLETRSRQAEQASEAKTRFLAGISHELRTPLHTILGFVRLLLKETAGEVRQRLVITERSGTQLLKLIDELLEFNQGAESPQQLYPEPVRLRDILAQIERAGSLMATEQNNAFTVEAAPDLPDAVSVDERRLLQVLQNLVGNACKYTRGGMVQVRVARDGSDAQAPKTGMCRLSFSVDDSGAGIAPEDDAHIFDVFARGTASHGQPGLGLGLAIAQQWVKAMGGEIRVSSAVGRGSSFFFTLVVPLATAGASAAAFECRTFMDWLATAVPTVLVVDDIAENRLLLRDLCERWGFKVTEAGDGDDALKACVGATPPIDAVLVDQFMPRMDGWEFLRRVRELPSLRHLPTALISASTAQKPPGLAPDIDFDLVLGKPLDEDALACFLCRHLAGARECGQQFVKLDELSRIALPAEELEKFRAMVELGRVEALADWAGAFLSADPAFGAFAGRVVQYCRAADVAALERMADAATQPHLLPKR